MDTPPATPEPAKDSLAPILDLQHLQLATTSLIVVSILRRIRGYLNFYNTFPNSARLILDSLNAFSSDKDIYKAYTHLTSEDASHFRGSLFLWLKIIDKTLSAISYPTLPSDSDRYTLEACLAILNSVISCPIVHKMQSIEEIYGLDEVAAGLTFDMAMNGFWKGSRGIPIVLDRAILGNDGVGAKFIRVFLGLVEEVGRQFAEETVECGNAEVNLEGLRKIGRVGSIWEQLKG